MKMFKITLPVSKKVVFFDDFTYGEHKKYAKIILSRDEYMIESMFNEIFETYSGLNEKETNVIDKFTFLCELYSFSVGDQCELNIKQEEKSFVFKFLLSELCEKLRNIEFESTIKINDDLSIQLSPDNVLNKSIGYESLFDFIKSITWKGESYPVSNQILAILPAGIDKSIGEHVIKVEEALKSLFPIDEIRISMLNTSLYDILKIIWYKDLKEYYGQIYAITENSKIESSYLESITTADVDLLLSMIKEQKKKEADAQQQEQRKNQHSGFRNPQ